MIHRYGPASEEQQKIVRALVSRSGERATAKHLRIGRATLGRVLAGAPLSNGTHRALDRIKPKVRQRGEFAAVATDAPAAPFRRRSSTCWDLESIRAARDDQMRGKFARPAEMAKAMRTDPAIFVARRARLNTIDTIQSKLCPVPGARGEAVAKRAGVSCFAPRSVLKSIAGTLLDHNVAFAVVRREVHDDGARVDMTLEEWPIEHVEWREHEKAFFTAVRGQPAQRIKHGDGRWIVFRLEAEQPWTNATMGAACFVWAASAEAIQNWGAALRSHGKAVVMGELPEGYPLSEEGKPGVLSPDAQSFLDMLADVVEGDAPAGLRVAGAKTDLLFNGSTAWQIFKELVENRERAATRIYLGVDAMLGSVGNAPGQDISALFNVTTSILQGDFQALEEGLRTGLYEPWCAVNFGSSLYTPRLEFLLPDPDKEKRNDQDHKRAQQRAERRTLFLAALESYRKQGATVDQPTIDRLAVIYDVDDPPILAPVAARSVALPLAPTDIAKAVALNEIRGSLGLPPLTDGRGEKTLPQLEAEANAAPAPGAPPPPSLRVVVGEDVWSALHAVHTLGRFKTKAGYLRALSKMAA